MSLFPRPHLRARRGPFAQEQLEKKLAALRSHSQGSGRYELCGEQGRALRHKGKGRPGDTAFKTPPGQRSAQMLPAPAPALLSDRTAPKQAPSNTGGQDNATAFLRLSCTFLTKTLKSPMQSSSKPALSLCSKPSFCIRQLACNHLTPPGWHSSAGTGPSLPRRLSLALQQGCLRTAGLACGRVPEESVGEAWEGGRPEISHLFMSPGAKPLPKTV